jgi:antitoxin component YwqK of YwqJK toxin-antitoxin module
MADLNIAEIPYEDGTTRYRYARYMAEDGTRWIRHGPFFAYHPNGERASEGNYVDGAEDGVWTDFHANGQMAARGNYAAGAQVGTWEYWDADGVPSD